MQPWAKIKDMDDNNVELKLDTNRLVGERKPKKPSLFRRRETSTQADVRRTKDVIIMMDLGVCFFPALNLLKMLDAIRWCLKPSSPFH